MQYGFMYLVAVMDWFSRHVLSERVFSSMDVDFCLEALDEALQLAHLRSSTPIKAHSSPAASYRKAIG